MGKLVLYCKNSIPIKTTSHTPVTAINDPKSEKIPNKLSGPKAQSKRSEFREKQPEN